MYDFFLFYPIDVTIVSLYIIEYLLNTTKTGPGIIVNIMGSDADSEAHIGQFRHFLI